MESRLKSILLAALYVLLFAGLTYFSLCGDNAPLCRSEAELFYVEPQVMAGIRPYAARWLSRPPEQSGAQRAEVARELGVSITMRDVQDFRRESVPVVWVEIEHSHGWTRGLLFTLRSDLAIREDGMLRIKKLEDGIYAFNFNF